MSENHVLVFDICSSTLILDDLQRTNQSGKYWDLVNDISSFLSENGSVFGYEIYKFLGDGFILIFYENTIIDQVLLFTIRLVDHCKHAIMQFLEDHVEITNLPRKGITIGLDKGVLYEQTLEDKSQEFIGRPLNMATRLQSSLNRPEHSNKCLMSKRVYKEITKANFKKICSKTTRKLRNMVFEEEITCYEFAPLFFEKADISQLKESKREPIKNYIAQNEPVKKEFEYIHTTATGAIEHIDLTEFVDFGQSFRIRFTADNMGESDISGEKSVK